MSEIETALLIVLIIVVILLIWRWVRASGDSCLQDCKKQCDWIKKADADRKKPVKPGYSPLNPDLSAARKSERDGYGDANVEHDLSESLYGPGGDAHDSYMAANFESMRDRYRPRNRLESDALNDLDAWDESIKYPGLDNAVVKGHQYFLQEMPHRTTGASMQTILDSHNPPNSWVGLRRHAMHIAKSEAGARTVSSEDYRQMHAGAVLRWGNQVDSEARGHCWQE